jgi:hypothetical protein
MLRSIPPEIRVCSLEERQVAVSELTEFVGKKLWESAPAWSLQGSCDLIPIQQFCVSNGSLLLESFTKAGIPTPEVIYMLGDNRSMMLHGSLTTIAAQFYHVVMGDEVAFFVLPVRWILALNHDGCLFYLVPRNDL